MIISRTPFRISFFGGGTDHPQFFQDHGGEVIGAAIKRYCWVMLRELPPFFNYRHRLVYSKQELVNETSEIQHPVIRAIFDVLHIRRGIEVHHDADLPARAGLGSSSSFTVGLLNALSAYGGARATKLSLANDAIHIEREVLLESGGNQDQIWAAFGGFNRIVFHTDGQFDVLPLIVSKERCAELNGSLMLFFTGFARTAAEIEKQKIANFDKRQKQLHELSRLVLDARKVLEGDRYSLDDFGRLLDVTWRLKRELSDAVSSAEIDQIYENGRAAGAIGGKLLGAGGGGFMLFYVPRGRQAAVRAALAPLVEVTVELGAKGSEIVFYETGSM